MKARELAVKLDELTTRQPLTIIGAAVIDVIADAYALPYRGCDIELKQQSMNIGGCALNIAIALKRLGIAAQNALPVGQGVWADIIRQSLEKQNITTVVQTDEGDNGWCLALVEPDGERTLCPSAGSRISGTTGGWRRYPSHRGVWSTCRAINWRHRAVSVW